MGSVTANFLGFPYMYFIDGNDHVFFLHPEKPLAQWPFNELFIGL
jgi:hypothetical protein